MKKMKKLKLKALELGSMELLTRAQLKNVLGGDYGGDYSQGCDEKPCTGGHQGSTCTTASGLEGKCNWEPCTGYGYYFYYCSTGL